VSDNHLADSLDTCTSQLSPRHFRKLSASAVSPQARAPMGLSLLGFNAFFKDFFSVLSDDLLEIFLPQCLSQPHLPAFPADIIYHGLSAPFCKVLKTYLRSPFHGGIVLFLLWSIENTPLTLSIGAGDFHFLSRVSLPAFVPYASHRIVHREPVESLKNPLPFLFLVTSATRRPPPLSLHCCYYISSPPVAQPPHPRQWVVVSSFDVLGTLR